MPHEVIPQTPGEPDHAAETGWLDSLPLRTLAQNVGVDVLLAASAVVYEATVTDGTGIAWGALGLLLIKSCLNTLASSVMKRVRPPEL